MEPTNLPGASDLPQFADRRNLWRELRVTAVEPSVSAERYAQALREVYVNGQVRIGSFRAEGHPIFDWYASRNQLHEMGFFKEWWNLSLVREVMPEPLLDLNFFSSDVFDQSSPFLLGGALGWALSQGGAYQVHQAGPSHAKKLGDELAAGWIDERYDDVLVYESHVAWSEFFLDVAWDRTWVALDKRQRQVHFLCATDTD